jgi:hypothetical protein
MTREAAMEKYGIVERLKNCGIYSQYGPFIGGVYLDSENAERVAAVMAAACSASIQIGIHLEAYRSTKDKMGLPSAERLQDLKDTLDNKDG